MAELGRSRIPGAMEFKNQVAGREERKIYGTVTRERDVGERGEQSV